jgi:hypothetical protein
VRTVECVTPPPVPVIVIVIGKVRVGAFLATVRVKFDVPEPVMELGLKLPITPDGTPVADKVRPILSGQSPSYGEPAGLH